MLKVLSDAFVAADTQELVARMTTCIEQVRCWMASNRLRLNPSKTELIWLSSPRRTNLLSTSLIRLFGTVSPPGISELSLTVICRFQHSHITSECFYYLRQLRLVRRSLTMDAAHALVRAMIHSRLDYCNSLLAGLSTGQMSRLQSVLRAAAWLVLGLPGRAPVSAAMHDTLHWLSFPQRVMFKLCLLTYKCLHGLALPVALLHVTDLCSWPSSVTFSWRKQTAGTTVLLGQLLDCVHSVLLVRLPGMICWLICATWTYHGYNYLDTKIKQSYLNNFKLVRLSRNRPKIKSGSLQV